MKANSGTDAEAAIQLFDRVIAFDRAKIDQGRWRGNAFLDANEQVGAAAERQSIGMAEHLGRLSEGCRSLVGERAHEKSCRRPLRAARLC